MNKHRRILNERYANAKIVSDTIGFDTKASRPMRAIVIIYDISGFPDFLTSRIFEIMQSYFNFCYGHHVGYVQGKTPELFRKSGQPRVILAKMVRLP
jgi:hypothetical protein